MIGRDFLVRLSVLGVFGAACPGSAEAAVDAPFRSGTYYEQNGIERCSGGNGCTLVFSPAPAGKKLTITRVTCFIGVQGTPLIQVGLAVRKSETQVARTQFLVPNLVDSEPGEFTYAVNAETSLLVLGTPVVQSIMRVADSTSETGLACQISGQLS